MDQYILVNGIPTPEPDLITWGRWFQTADRTVAITKVGNAEVSTVFLGLDHSFGGGKPMLYETLVFGGDMDGEMNRYASLADAVYGHERMVERVRNGRTIGE